MKSTTFRKKITLVAAAAVIAFGFAAPIQAATADTTAAVQYYTFNWYGYQVKIPFYTFYTPSRPAAPLPTQPTQPAKPSQPAETPPQQNAPAAPAATTEVQRIVDLVNAERAKAGLAPVKLNAALSKMATVKAEDMRDNNYFAHNSPTYGSPFDMMKSFGIQYSSAGENIAAGQKSPEDVMNAWMNSSGHRANILSANFTEIGIGVVKGGSYGTYWVQEFIRP